MRRHALGHTLGHVAVSAPEPLPLVYSASASSASTECTGQDFYSAAPMTCMPIQTDLTGTALIRLHDQVIKLEEQRFSALEWEWRPLSDIRITAPAYELLAARDGPWRISDASEAPQAGSTVPPRQPASDGTYGGSQPRHGTWHASVKISIRPPETLVPAFCGSLIARSYSLLFRVRVCGAHGKKCGLELPLQVVHPSPQPSLPGAVAEQVATPCEGPAALLAQEEVLPTYENVPMSTSSNSRRPPHE
ncbi:hypothetical protein NKR19_g6163 [Coniochaeta hoffmannii]|uniref:Uncharacterized protein n=1 Tax=Coniochaeta hoffmannii TaxID=91930 RepID=A0AA38VQU2_9PEZI|nr:hypothetical protein NKR19_g6163 [Coniochaeta hoffmannii]